MAGLDQETDFSFLLQVTVFDVPSHWTDILGTGAIISAVLGKLSLVDSDADLHFHFHLDGLQILAIF